MLLYRLGNIVLKIIDLKNGRPLLIKKQTNLMFDI